MLRVIGVTYDHTVNYGSCFQAYALQRAIGQISIGGEACDYRIAAVRESGEWRAIEAAERKSSSPVLALKKQIAYLLALIHRKQFRAFEREHMRFAPVESLGRPNALDDQADAFVCGSDVVWNVAMNRHVGMFYLDFTDKYKFSYAASFGRPAIGTKEAEEIRPKIGALNAISCRETSGCGIIRDRFGRTAEQTADPVLLLRRREWEEIAAGDTPPDGYIFVYVTHLNDTMEAFLSRLRAETGLKVIMSVWGPRQILRKGVLQVQKPEYWLQLLRNAEYVVTNSFHATAFSVLFHKKFFTVVQGKKDEGINVRMYDFLHSLGLDDRMHAEVPETMNLAETDYRDADTALADMREASLAFLRRNLEAAYRQKMQREKGAE